MTVQKPVKLVLNLRFHSAMDSILEPVPVLEPPEPVRRTGFAIPGKISLPIYLPSEWESLELRKTIKFLKVDKWFPLFILLNSSLSLAGDSSHTTVLWKQGERVITAGSVKVRKDGRLSMAEASSLKISGVGVADTGQWDSKNASRLQHINKLCLGRSLCAVWTF